MNAVIETGQTGKKSGKVLLSSHALKSGQGEHICLLLALQADQHDAKTLEKESLAVIKHALLETEGDPDVRLDGTLKELNGLVKGMLLSGSVADLHAIIALLDRQGTLHVSHAGRAEGYLIRESAASQITEYSKGRPTPAFVHISSGDLYGKDMVILSTQRLLRHVTPAQMAQMAGRGEHLVDDIVHLLEGEKEEAAIATIHIASGGSVVSESPAAPASRTARSRGTSKRRGAVRASGSSVMSKLPTGNLLGAITGGLSRLAKGSKFAGSLATRLTAFQSDLRDPRKKKRAHFLLLAGVLAVFLVIWMGVKLSASTQQHQTREELKALVEQVDGDIQTAETRRLAGDSESANAILQRAEDTARQVMDNESGYYRLEALDLFDRIRTKREEINNITRLSPRSVINLASKNPDIIAQGIIGVKDGEFTVYDRQDLYRVLLNSVEEPDRIGDEELIVHGVPFERYQTSLYQMTDNSVVEIISGTETSMKTEDPSGWIAGKDIETYLRFLYVLSPENNQIYKYERFSNRYAAPVEYNVNGDLAGAIDMAIDGSVYVLKEGGEIVKLFRGEVRPFTIRFAEEDILSGATKIYKVREGNFYFLDPEQAAVVISTDGGATGESSYTRQYLLEGDQIGTLRDLYVDPEETRLYVLDEKRVYAIDLGTR